VDAGQWTATAWTAIGTGFAVQLAGTWYLKRKLDRFEERLDRFDDRLNKSLDRFAA
jgi:hypothetical protein